MRDYDVDLKLNYQTGIDKIDKIAKFKDSSFNVLYGQNLNTLKCKAIEIAKGIKKDFKENYSSSTYIPIYIRSLNHSNIEEANIIYIKKDIDTDKNIASLIKDIYELKTDSMRPTCKTGFRVMDLKLGIQKDVVKPSPIILIIDDIEILCEAKNEIIESAFETLQRNLKDSGIVILALSNRVSDDEDGNKIAKDSNLSLVMGKLDNKLYVSDNEISEIKIFKNTYKGSKLNI